MLCALLTAAVLGQADSATTQPAMADPASPDSRGASRKELSRGRDRVSYSLGAMIGMQLKRSFPKHGNIDRTLVIPGFQDAVAGNKLVMTEQEINRTLAVLNDQMKAKRKKVSERNKKNAMAYLAKHAKEPGVQVTASGLQYIVVEAGTGEPEKLNDKVVVEYTGTLINDHIFESSKVRGEPITFRVNADQVIDGWIEVLQLMNTGAKWHVVVPPHLAYGETGSPNIPPNSDLIYDIELLEINRAEDERP